MFHYFLFSKKDLSNIGFSQLSTCKRERVNRKDKSFIMH